MRVFIWLLAFVHLLALGMGLGAIRGRAGALRRLPDPLALKQALMADTAWGIAAALWISTGLVRLFMGTEKPFTYYMGNHFFWGKMLLLLTILALEVPPMMALTRWRMALRRGAVPDTSAAARFARTSAIQGWLVVLMVLAATGMARGFGTRE
jgi:putative membrane protein